MIKFFRRIRYNLLKKNRFTRYLLYAIGEIILVVIGILIALEINNRNELRKNEKIVQLALQEIQSNLLVDINIAQENLDNYLTSYSAHKKIFNYENPWTYDDYKNGDVEILGNRYYNFVINKNGHENLMKNLDKLPLKYYPILYDLKDLYVDLNQSNQASNRRIQNTVYTHLDFIHTQNWRVHRRKFSAISEEEMDYYINNDAYKRYVLKFMNDRNIVFRSSQRYRIKAIETYIKIDSLFNKKNDQIPFELLGMIKSENDVEEYLGTYKFKDTTIPIPFSVKLHWKNHHLYSVDDLGDTLKHYMIDNKRFMWMQPDLGRGYPAVWEIGENNDGSIIIEFLNSEQPNLIKVD